MLKHTRSSRRKSKGWRIDGTRNGQTELLSLEIWVYWAITAYSTKGVPRSLCSNQVVVWMAMPILTAYRTAVNVTQNQESNTGQITSFMIYC